MAFMMQSLHRQQLLRGEVPTDGSTHSSQLRKNLIKIWDMARKCILPITIEVVLKTRHPLPCAESESSGDDQIAKHWQMARKKSDGRSRL